MSAVSIFCSIVIAANSDMVLKPDSDGSSGKETRTGILAMEFSGSKIDNEHCKSHLVLQADGSHCKMEVYPMR